MSQGVAAPTPPAEEAGHGGGPADASRAPEAVPATAEPGQRLRPLASPLMRDAFVTVVTRFGLAVVIFATDIVLARLLGPSAKGRFSLVLLYSQFAALIVGIGMDQALGVVAGRDRATARAGFANSVVWTLVVGGFAVVLSCWLYGLPTDVRPRGPLASLMPNLSASQFIYSALALPGELFFAIGLFTLLGRRRVVAFSVIRVLRRAVLFVLVIGIVLAPSIGFSLDVALVLNLVALAVTAFATAWVAWRDGSFSLRPSGPLLAEELRFGSRAIVGTLAERLQFRADSFLVNLLLGRAGIRATGIYSVTQSLAETLWYVPNSLGTVMFSRAVDPRADAGRVAAVLTRTTIAVTVIAAVPAFILGPRVVRFVYGSTFSDAGVALRLILPGIVAYSVVAVLSRYIVGRGRPGVGTMILVTGLATNIASNLVLIPRYGINGAAASSSISYAITALLTLGVFHRLSGRGWVETLVVRRADLVAVFLAGRALLDRARGRRTGPLVGLRGDPAAQLIMGEHDPGEEP